MKYLVACRLSHTTLIICRGQTKEANSCKELLKIIIEQQIIAMMKTFADIINKLVKRAFLNENTNHSI